MRRLSSILCVALFGAVAAFACDSDKKDVTSQQGESCESTADCAGNLACFGGTCLPANVTVTVNGNQCVAQQCAAAADCCGPTVFEPASNCASAKTACDTDATNTAACNTANGPRCICNVNNEACEENLCKFLECTTAADCCADFVPDSICTTYAENCASDPTTYASQCSLATGPDCVCDATTQACTNNQCVTRTNCTDNSNCFSTNFCSTAGYCAQCDADTDCTSPQKCDATQHVCISPECTTDLDCDAFNACQANKCVEVGCTNDRECMVKLDSYLASCDKTTTPVPTCKVSCKNDAECKSLTPLGQCVSGTCKDPGCETDEECRAVLENDPAIVNKSSYPGIRAVCVVGAH